MRIRLTGTAAECAATIELLRLVDGIEVVEASGGCANGDGSRLERVYVEVRVGGTGQRSHYRRDEPDGGPLPAGVGGYAVGGRRRGVRR